LHADQKDFSLDISSTEHLKDFLEDRAHYIAIHPSRFRNGHSWLHPNNHRVFFTVQAPFALHSVESEIDALSSAPNQSISPHDCVYITYSFLYPYQGSQLLRGNFLRSTETTVALHNLGQHEGDIGNVSFFLCI